MRIAARTTLAPPSQLAAAPKQNKWARPLVGALAIAAIGGVALTYQHGLFSSLPSDPPPPKTPNPPVEHPNAGSFKSLTKALKHSSFIPGLAPRAASIQTIQTIANDLIWKRGANQPPKPEVTSRSLKSAPTLGFKSKSDSKLPPPRPSASLQRRNITELTPEEETPKNGSVLSTPVDEAPSSNSSVTSMLTDLLRNREQITAAIESKVEDISANLLSFLAERVKEMLGTQPSARTNPSIESEQAAKELLGSELEELTLVKEQTATFGSLLYLPTSDPSESQAEVPPQGLLILPQPLPSSPPSSVTLPKEVTPTGRNFSFECGVKEKGEPKTTAQSDSLALVAPDSKKPKTKQPVDHSPKNCPNPRQLGPFNK